MIYCKEEIISKIKKALENPRELYKLDIINYRGKTNNGEKYTEIEAEFLCKNVDLLESITPIKRNKPYKVNSHDGTTSNSVSNREEERIALSMFNQKDFGENGQIIDYQVPLKNSHSDKGLGKIDLLLKKDNELHILELKKPNSKETLLRAIIEAFTYYKTVDSEKVLSEYGCSIIKKYAFVGENSLAHKEFLDEDNIYLKRLMNLLEVGIYTYTIEMPYKIKLVYNGGLLNEK